MSARTANRFAPSLQTLDDRLVPTIVAGQVGTEVTLTGDNHDDTALIRDTGGDDVYVLANGTDWYHFTGVTKITANTEGGNDAVQYRLDGNLRGDQSRELRIGLGSDYDPTFGRDTFTADLAPGIHLENGSKLYIGADGGNGNDFLSVTALGVNVDKGAWFKTDIVGGFDDDVVSQVYSGGLMDGAMAMRSYGVDGTDTIREWMDFDAASTGAVGGLVYGGDGTDTLGMYVYLAKGMTYDKLDLHANDDGGVFDNVSAGGDVTVYL